MYGQDRSALLSHKLPRVSSPTQELSISIDNEINQLDHLISYLQTRRALLLRQKNTQRSAILSFPSGILAEIFVLTNGVDETSGCLSDPTIRLRHSFVPIRLGAVCSRWRHVAWNSPWLWTQLTLPGCWISEPRSPLVQILNIYYHNVKAMTLDLSIGCSHSFNYHDMENNTREDVFNTIFVENPDRLRNLRLRNWPKKCLPPLEKIQETTMFSQLQKLSITCPSDAFEEKLVLKNAPRLQEVELEGVSANANIILPWTQITYLSLYDLSSDLSLEIFTQCINLECFACSRLFEAYGRGTTVVRDSIKFPHLCFICCLDKEIPVSWRRAIGRFFEFPTLESIIWYPDWSAGVEHQLIRKYSESIQTLKFRFRKTDQLEIKSMLSALDSLKRLEIYFQNSIELSILNLLTPSKGWCFLPSLKKLHLTTRSNEMTPKIVQKILTMAKLRRTLTPAKLDHLMLSYQVSSFELDPWPRPFVEGIKKFVSGGMKVVIKAGYKDVHLDWLHAD